MRSAALVLLLALAGCSSTYRARALCQDAPVDPHLRVLCASYRGWDEAETPHGRLIARDIARAVLARERAARRERDAERARAVSDSLRHAWRTHR